jgi:hypothetical protein
VTRDEDPATLRMIFIHFSCFDHQFLCRLNDEDFDATFAQNTNALSLLNPLLSIAQVAAHPPYVDKRAISLFLSVQNLR